MQDDDDPEGDQERWLPRFVAELALSQNRTRPPAEQSQQVQRPLGHSPPADSGSPLVQSVSDEADEAGHGDQPEVSGGGIQHAYGSS